MEQQWQVHNLPFGVNYA